MILKIIDYICSLKMNALSFPDQKAKNVARYNEKQASGKSFF